MLGLGAFTSVIGDAGITIANALDVPVTTGDSYTVTVAVDAIREAARAMEIPFRGSHSCSGGCNRRDRAGLC